ncbi:DUF2769 domain-containing protein [Candidatus Bathyarchaeota archaeon]|nr:DUF2769 domain-containing protein [Candidatus Bathyarchaeota archaeon]
MKKVNDNEKNVGICTRQCGSCPSYPGTDEWLFCARSKSASKISKRGCFCPSCQVYADYELSSSYFCDKGPPK